MAGDTEPIIKAKNLVHKFSPGKNEVTAINNISLEVYPGEFIALIGPSGSGKSTLLNLIGGCVGPSVGK